MSWVNVDEATFYWTAWCLGFLSASLTMARDRRKYRKSVSECLVAGAYGGLLSCACVGILVGRLDGPISHHWYYLSLSILIGLSARQADAIREMMLNKVLSYRIVSEERKRVVDCDKCD